MRCLGGGYAQYAAVHHSMLMPVPEGLSMIEAAALPEAFATACKLVYGRGAKAGDVLLMHAGASGLCKRNHSYGESFRIRVITSVLSADIAKSIAHLKADVVIDTSSESVAERLKVEAQKGYPVNIAIDCLGENDGRMSALCSIWLSLDYDCHISWRHYHY